MYSPVWRVKVFKVKSIAKLLPLFSMVSNLVSKYVQLKNAQNPSETQHLSCIAQTSQEFKQLTFQMLHSPFFINLPDCSVIFCAF